LVRLVAVLIKGNDGGILSLNKAKDGCFAI